MIVYDAAERSRAPMALALKDLLGGIRQAELWGTMGWLDISQRYHRSVIGPFWVTLGLAAFVIGIGYTYGAIFKIPLANYLPYITVGIVVWTLISTLMIEGCNVFIVSEAAIKQMPISPSIHVFRLVLRNLIIFAHNSLIIILILLYFGLYPGPNIFTSLAGLVLILLNGVGFSLTLGTISARFRDIIPLITNLIQTLFFITPVLWRAESLGERGAIADYNPLYQLIEIVRAPLLGGQPTSTAWFMVLGFTALNISLSLLVYSRFRWRIPYWL